MDGEPAEGDTLTWEMIGAVAAAMRDKKELPFPWLCLCLLCQRIREASIELVGEALKQSTEGKGVC